MKQIKYENGNIYILYLIIIHRLDAFHYIDDNGTIMSYFSKKNAQFHFVHMPKISSHITACMHVYMDSAVSFSLRPLLHKKAFMSSWVSRPKKHSPLVYHSELQCQARIYNGKQILLGNLAERNLTMRHLVLPPMTFKTKINFLIINIS